MKAKALFLAIFGTLLSFNNIFGQTGFDNYLGNWVDKKKEWNFRIYKQSGSYIFEGDLNGFLGMDYKSVLSPEQGKLVLKAVPTMGDVPLVILNDSITIIFAGDEFRKVIGRVNTVNGSSSSSSSPVSGSMPQIGWETKTIDYGTIKKGDESKATRYFKFTNNGRSPLIISKCQSSCPCVVSTCPTDAIAAGQSGTVTVHYDVNRIGHFTKIVVVTSNTASPNTTLQISGTVEE